jgi:hypothetical protein
MSVEWFGAGELDCPSFGLEILSLDAKYNYFALPGNKCADGLELVNVPNVVDTAILYLSSSKELQGTIKLRHPGSLQIVYNGSLYLHDVSFINIWDVTLVNGYVSGDGEVVSDGGGEKLGLENVVAVSLKVVLGHNSLLMRGELVACNKFQVSGFGNVNGADLKQILSNDISINAASVMWGGVVNSCEAKSSTENIRIVASGNIDLLASSRFSAKVLSVDGVKQLQVAGLMAASESFNMNAIDVIFGSGAKISVSNIDSYFSAKNLTIESSSFLDLKGAKIVSDHIVLSGNVLWQDVLTFMMDASEYSKVEFIGATLQGSKFILNQVAELKIDMSSVIAAQECTIFNVQKVILGGLLKCTDNIDVIAGSIKLLGTSKILSHHKFSMQAQDMELLGILSGANILYVDVNTIVHSGLIDWESGEILLHANKINISCASDDIRRVVAYESWVLPGINIKQDGILKIVGADGNITCDSPHDGFIISVSGKAVVDIPKLTIDLTKINANSLEIRSLDIVYNTSGNKGKLFARDEMKLSGFPKLSGLYLVSDGRIYLEICELSHEAKHDVRAKDFEVVLQGCDTLKFTSYGLIDVSHQMTIKADSEFLQYIFLLDGSVLKTGSMIIDAKFKEVIARCYEC